MEKRQALMVAVLAVVVAAAGGFWWFTQQAPAEEEVMTVAAPVAPAAPPAPVIATPTTAGLAAAPAESDAVALQEEALDKEKAEMDDLAARAADLEEQVRDGELIKEGKAQQIARLEAELKRLEKENAAASKKK
jgi:hypothetical protein